MVKAISIRVEIQLRPKLLKGARTDLPALQRSGGPTKAIVINYIWACVRETFHGPRGRRKIDQSQLLGGLPIQIHTHENSTLGSFHIDMHPPCTIRFVRIFFGGTSQPMGLLWSFGAFNSPPDTPSIVRFDTGLGLQGLVPGLCCESTDWGSKLRRFDRCPLLASGPASLLNEEGDEFTTSNRKLLHMDAG